MASGPITSWQIEREKVEAVTDFIFLGSKITENGDCSHEIKKYLLFERKAMTTSLCRQRFLIVRAMVFPVVMYGCESWTITKPECQRINAFELCCWRRLLRVLWTARRSNQSILNEINFGYSLEVLLLKLKLQYFVHLMQRAYLEKTLMLGKNEDKRKRGWQRMRWLDSIINSIDMNLSKLQEIVKKRKASHAAVHGVAKSWI